MRPNTPRKPHGELRRSQIVTTFGPGAMLDLPNYSVLVGGLESWSKDRDEIKEPRLTRKIAKRLELPSVKLYSPPIERDDPNAPSSGIDCFRFPEWFVTQDAERAKDNPSSRSRMLVHFKALYRGRYVDDDRVKRHVVPIRFVRACKNGHIGDIDWYAFVHRGPSECVGQHRRLWVDERGTSGDLTEVFIRCQCGLERNMVEASNWQGRPLGDCDGNRPWLGPFSRERCNEPSRLLIRTASNSYFPEKMAVISLPDRDDKIKDAVNAAWEQLELVDEIEQLRYERRKDKVNEALREFTDEEALAEIVSRRSGVPNEEKHVKLAELETLVAARAELGEDRSDGTFFARSLPRAAWDRSWMESVERVVLVHRLREVVAQVGFTRFESTSADVNGELEIGVRRASLAREVTWLPAIENRGEGVFIQLRTAAIEEWRDRQDVMERGAVLNTGFAYWQREHEGTQRQFFGLPYVMLHSLSHMLITALSLECGYPASSIRERVYAIDGVGYGILLYTGTPDAEGTLGGLVQVGRRIHELMHQALETATLCSNDPVCAQHDPPSANENRYLHGAACHGCLLIAETSCEQQNDFLDRALVVPTVASLGAEFFKAVQ